MILELVLALVQFFGSCGSLLCSSLCSFGLFIPSDQLLFIGVQNVNLSLYQWHFLLSFPVMMQCRGGGSRGFFLRENLV